MFTLSTLDVKKQVNNGETKMEGIYEKNACYLTAYTREPEPGLYPSGLARSVHFAISYDGKSFEALNHNYGILFAQADVTSANTLNTKALKNPYIFALAQGGWGIAAVRLKESGEADPDSRGKILLWRTENFTEFTFLGLLPLYGNGQMECVRIHYVPERNEYVATWTDENGCWKIHGTDLYHWISDSVSPAVWKEEKSPCFLPYGAIPGNIVAVDANAYDRIRVYWGRLTHVDTMVPSEIEVSSSQDIAAVKAQAVYSDGSTALKKVDWDISQVDFSKPGIYNVEGTLRGNPFHFPLTHGTGDPVIVPWKGKYYYLSTNDTSGDIGLYVREADCPEDLFAPDVERHLILDVDEEKQFIQTFWAPEFHIVGGEPYIFFAVGGKVWGPQCHVMHLKPGGRFTDPDAWETPRRVLRQDGSPLTEDGITLDMTCIKAGGRVYAAWSYRFGIGTPQDTGSMLCIAPLNEKEPWKLAGEPMVLSRPLLSWENVEGTINNEGPYAFVTKEKVYLSYSGGAANSYTYAVGLLTADPNSDLADPANWEKSLTPVLTYYSVDGEYGPGHNSFFRDDFGDLWIAYHGETDMVSRLRCAGIRRVHFDLQGRPRFDLSAERDVSPRLSRVVMQVKVTKN